MDLNQKFQVKLAPLSGVTPPTEANSSEEERKRLRGGCTNLMYACQQGLTDTIVKAVRSQVNINFKSINLFHLRLSPSLEFSIIFNRKYLSVN